MKSFRSNKLVDNVGYAIGVLIGAIIIAVVIGVILISSAKLLDFLIRL